MLSSNLVRVLVKVYPRDAETGEPINETIMSHLEEFGHKVIIGRRGSPIVEETKEWGGRG